MPNRKSRETEGEAPRPEAAAPVTPHADPLPPPGAESEPAAPDDAPAAAADPEPVTVDAAAADPVTAEAPETPAPTASVESADPDPADEHHDDDSHDDEGGWSFAARALALLLALIAGAAIGIWGAPRLAPRLPSGLAPVADWLSPGSRDAEAEVARLEKRLDDGLGAVDSRLAGLADTGDIDAKITSAVDAARAEVETEIGAVRDSVAAIGGADTAQELARLDSALHGQTAELATLKEQLSGSAAAAGQATDEAVAKIDVYRAELDGVRAEVGTLRDQVSGLASRVDEVAATADRQIETAQTRVAAIQAESATALGAAEVQSDVALVRAAIAGGQPFADPLKQLASRPDLTVPDGLAAAAPTGVATMAALRDGFADAAHAAIQASILAAAGDGVMARTRAFVEAQVASRSLTPQSGTGTDAVLSRMEDKLRHDDLAGALAESAQLPSEAAAAMSGWLDAARLRAGAVDGLATLETAVPATN